MAYEILPIKMGWTSRTITPRDQTFYVKTTLLNFKRRISHFSTAVTSNIKNSNPTIGASVQRTIIEKSKCDD